MSLGTTQLAERGPGAGVTSVRRDRVAVVLVAAGVVGLCTWLAFVDPNHPGHYPTCPFLALTGHYCIGCGSLRAIHDLLVGNVGGALARNPLTVLLAVPYALAAWTSWSAKRLGRPIRFSSTQLPPWVLWSILALLMAFWVLRNVPGWTWLSPA